VNAVFTGSLLFHAYYVSPAVTPSEAPIVEGFLPEIENRGELRIGDRILRVGDVDTRGAGELGVSALTLGQARDGEVAMEIERGGTRQSIVLSLVGLEVPWIRIPLLLGFAIVGVIVLLRSPGSTHTRLMFVAFMNLVAFQAIFTGSSASMFYAGVFMFHVWGVIALTTIGIWVTRFPPNLDPSLRFHWAWGLAAGTLWAIPRITQFMGPRYRSTHSRLSSLPSTPRWPPPCSSCSAGTT
jgi:hypothetical protein